MIFIPENRVAAFEGLIDLPDDAWPALLAAVESSEPCKNLPEFAERVAARIPSDAGWHSSAESVVNLLGELYAVWSQQNVGLTAFLGDLREAIERHPQLRRPAIPENLAERVSAALSLHPTLGVSAKSMQLALEANHRFLNARVVSDIRPVFGAEDAAQPLAGFLVHELRIDYLVDDEKSADAYLLGREDLVALIEALQRALVKDEALKESVRKMGLRYVE